MQTIHLDISNKSVVPTVYAKQNDVGRKFEVVFTNSGLPYNPPDSSVFSVWYSGKSGEGNYTDIGDRSAFSINGNKVAVELITQMLTNDGTGVLCLVLNEANGNQIGSWNIPYLCEIVPGAESEKAAEYYTAFSKAVEELPFPDETLSIPGKAADAAATGAALLGKAPSGYGLGEAQKFTADEIDNLTRPGFYYTDDDMTIAGYFGNRWWMEVFAYGTGTTFATQRICSYWSGRGCVAERHKVNRTWSEWGWVNPPLELGTEYRTTETVNGKAVWTVYANIGTMSSSPMNVRLTQYPATEVVRYMGTCRTTTIPAIYGDLNNGWTIYAFVNLNNDAIQARIYAGSEFTGRAVYMQFWYTKD